MKKALKELSLLFTLTADERKLVAAVVALFLLGLAARVWHLKHEKPAPYEPAGVALATEGQGHE